MVMLAPGSRKELTPFASNLTVGDGDAGFTTSALVAAIIEASDNRRARNRVPEPRLHFASG